MILMLLKLALIITYIQTKGPPLMRRVLILQEEKMRRLWSPNRAVVSATLIS